tara:strand:- start:200 stop:493 length:294 start_codon:yes stop_codon:yes gene_type:complete
VTQNVIKKESPLVMYSCKKIVEKASDYTEVQLKWHERIAYKLHLLICGHCRLFLKQFGLMVQSFSKFKWQEDTHLNEKIIKKIHFKHQHHQGDENEK